jgi:flagellar biosynthesis/type III secretory pathway protein FliH
MQEVTHPEVLQAVQVLKSISASPQERRDAEMRLKYHRDITAIKSFGWQEGREEGIALGEARGKAEGIALGEARGQLEGKASILITLLTLKSGPLTSTTLAQIHAASPQQLDHWAEQILTAQDLDALMRTK